MLTRLKVRGFKSLADVGSIRLAPLTLFFGPNAAGKSNLLDALQVLSRLATTNTLAEAIGPPIRGLPIEAFTFPEGGLPALLATPSASPPRFRFSADVSDDEGALRYEIEVAINPRSGAFFVQDEFLARLDSRGRRKDMPAIERDPQQQAIRVRRFRKPPWEEEVGLHHTLLSNRRFSGKEYTVIERTREALADFRSYYLDPQVAMRASRSPQDVDDIGPLGENLAPFLYRLRAEKPKIFASVRRTLCTLIPSVEDLSVDLDPKRGVLDVEIRQNGIAFSSRVISEGTLRVLALACVATNPWAGSTIAFEEPENGVHPRRVELIADMLGAVAFGSNARRQVIITTHSPLFCAAVYRLARQKPREVCLYRAVRDGNQTRFEDFDPAGPLFADLEISTALTNPTEDAKFEQLLLRGLLDG